MARPPRLELGTPGLEGRCSIQLSYGRSEERLYRANASERSEPRERSEPTKRLARERVGEFEGRRPSSEEEGRCSIQLSYGRTEERLYRATRASGASHATGASRRSGSRESVWGSS